MDKVGVGFANPWPFDLEDIKARFDVMEGLGMGGLDVFFVDEGNRGLKGSWLPLSRDFVAASPVAPNEC